MNNETNDEKNIPQLIYASDELREFFTMNLLFKKTIHEPIYEKEIDEMLEKIIARNEFTTSEITIPGDVALEFIKIIKDKVKQKEMNLGILTIDIKNKKFSVKKFMEKTEDVLYTLKLRIASINDLKKREFKFLKSHPEIIYEYAGDNYNLEQLFEMVEKIKNFIKENEENFSFSQKNYLRANSIAETVFKNIELYIPKEYGKTEIEITYDDGKKERKTIFKNMEDTSYYANLSNIFVENKADYLGMRKFCKECLRNDGYEMVERVSTLGNMVGTELIIDGIAYGIKITPEEMRIIRV